MTTRYYEETPCPHDRWAEIGHVEEGFDDRTMDYRPPEGKTHPNHWCPGGQRRELFIKTEDFEIAAQAWDKFRAAADITGSDNFASAMGAESILRFFFTRVLAGAGLVGVAIIPLEEPE